MSNIVSAAFGGEFSDRLHSFIKQLQKDNARSARRDVAHDERFSAIEADVGFLAMMQVAMLKLLADKGIARDGELVDRLLMADRLDGVEDGALDVKRLREVIGIGRGQSPKQNAARGRNGAKGKPAAPAATAKGAAKGAAQKAIAEKAAAPKAAAPSSTRGASARGKPAKVGAGKSKKSK